MSDEEDDAYGSGKTRRAVHRREQRACDTCRKRRRACKAYSWISRTPVHENVCSGNGTRFPVKISKRRTYVQALEDRVKDAEMKVEQIAPPAVKPSEPNKSPKYGTLSLPPDSDVSFRRPGPGVELAALSIRAMNVAAPTAQDTEYLELIQGLTVLSLSNHQDHFHGEGSSAMVVKSAVDLRERYEEKDLVWAARREKYWVFTPTTDKIKHIGPYVFPPPELLASLVDLYFLHKNHFLPLLHRPTFETGLAQGLHLRDRVFGGIVLLVCGIGSRFSADPRVTPLGMDELLCGYQFFHQIQLGIDHMFGGPTIHHVQLYCLFVTFCEYANPSSCWTIVGTAIRMLQDVGAHRRPRIPTSPTVESELWKRAFWICLILDRQLSIGVGRPSMIPWEDFDAELPLEVDDEFWEDPVEPFVQPPHQGPSTIAFFNANIRLNLILGFAIGMLYALDKVRKRLAFRDSQWEERIVAELDSSLNEWVARIPLHLRWDATKQSKPISSLSARAELFLDQSAVLYAHYYFTQVTIHRPFIPQLRKGSPTGAPSLAVCTNAARSLAHVIRKIHGRKSGAADARPPFPGALMPAFMASIILTLNVWSGKRTGLPPHMNTATEEVKACMAYLKSCEKRWQGAGLFWDVLSELCTFSSVPVPVSPPPLTPTTTTGKVKKRTRLSQSPTAAPAAAVLVPQFSVSAERHGYAPPEETSSEWAPSRPKPMWPFKGSREEAADSPAMPSTSSAVPSQVSEPDLQTSTVELAQMPIFQRYSSVSGAGEDIGAAKGSDSTMLDAATVDVLAGMPTTFGGMEDWYTYFASVSQAEEQAWRPP
ncbi:hypothetical protein MIND_01416400 [Mycena indigotica]|uniref:Xylanolytic transcriptional activator regulatory domain-containing protein n=1 Tax=Mycena indigotica TaxID=2126181 RepID=A0A8H6RXZ1_9AGAR|nr:uncharacterized protein MIND_01416400 [Mycena indigotica]KAF7288996.1 hypothetical protein MIND_01416400 [Mycena indigotica]